MKTITFIRHGESVSNADGITMPHNAIPLSALGLRQAATLANALNEEPAAKGREHLFARPRSGHSRPSQAEGQLTVRKLPDAGPRPSCGSRALLSFRTKLPYLVLSQLFLENLIYF